jgi:hypothetical protein
MTVCDLLLAMPPQVYFLFIFCTVILVASCIELKLKIDRFRSLERQHEDGQFFFQLDRTVMLKDKSITIFPQEV